MATNESSKFDKDSLGMSQTARGLPTSFANSPAGVEGAMAATVSLLIQHQQQQQASALGGSAQMSSTNNTTETQSNQSAAAALSKSLEQVLPTSAPVSSLLPPIPMSHDQNASPALQLAALLNASNSLTGQANGGQSLQQQQQQHQHDQRHHSANHQLSVLLEQQQHAPARHASAPNFATGTHHMVGARTPALAPAGSLASPLVSNMHSWTRDQLEQHVNILQQLKQPVPQTVSMLLAAARRKEEKKNAKRVANRKSAGTSRARKKALVQEMTELNARLKRQALILSLLPDLVVVIDAQGDITFCSAQVERILRHSVDDLVESSFMALMVPSSQKKLRQLTKELIEDSEKKVAAEEDNKKAQDVPTSSEEVEGSSKAAAASVGVDSGTEARIVSDPSFPPSVVKVDAAAGSDENEISEDTSASDPSKQPSPLTSTISLARSPTASSLGNSGSDDGAQAVATGEGGKASAGAKRKAAQQMALSSSDASNSSSLSADASKLQKANANLERNVRWHNKKMKVGLNAGFKDDVIGAAVTANNASARLSSLRHSRESSSEEDSGYRESNDSREETSSSSDSSESNGRQKPLAPTCNVCLIRNDLTTIWCEVTSSIWTRDLKEESDESFSDDAKPRKTGLARMSSNASKLLDGSAPTDAESSTAAREEIKEILLCLRPIRDGDKVDEKYRFVPRTSNDSKQLVSVSSSAGPSSGSGDTADPSSDPTLTDGPAAEPSGPPKRRLRSAETSPSKRSREGEKPAPSFDSDAVETLMCMNKQDT